MEQDKQDCKIVQDLLPNYIENLTCDETNEYIRNHIAKCPKCAKVLNNMEAEIEIEPLNQDKEIKYLKGIRKRVKRTIAVVSLVIIITASCIIGYFYNKSKIQVNNYTFLRASYITENQEGTIDGNIYGTLMAVFDEKGVCKSVRVVEKGYTEQNLEKEKRLISKYIDYNTNLIVSNDELHYNTNIWNGIDKEKVKNQWIKNYTMIKIEEI